MLWLMPYLFLSAFGEAFHQHPLDHATQSTLSSGIAFSASQSHQQIASDALPQSDRAASLECLICAWSAQSSAHLATLQVQLPITSAIAPTMAFDAALVSSFHLALRSRGPPFSSVV